MSAVKLELIRHLPSCLTQAEVNLINKRRRKMWQTRQRRANDRANKREAAAAERRFELSLRKQSRDCGSVLHASVLAHCEEQVWKAAGWAKGASRDVV